MSILPAAYFGSIAYFEELARHQTVVIECKEKFPKQSYRNRCDIVGANDIIALYVPLERPNGSQTITDEVLILPETKWKNEHWKSIRSAYESSPYFEFYGNEIKELIFSETKSLVDYNLKITQRIIDWLDLEVTMEKSTFFAPIEKNDHREKLLSKKEFRTIEKSPYIQVFEYPGSFYKGLSILDPIMCLGPLARNLILKKS